MVARLFAVLTIVALVSCYGQETKRVPPRNRDDRGKAPTVGDSAVSDISVEAISYSSAKIRFQTAIPGGNTGARIDYGPTPELGYESRVDREGSGSSTARSRTIGGLRPETRYYFVPAVTDAKNGWDTSWRCPSAGRFAGFVCEREGSVPFFTTAPAPAVIPAPPGLPEPVDTSMPSIDGQTFTVSVDGEKQCVDFQKQLAAAAAADSSLNHQVVIPAGATCYGQFTLPRKIGPGVVVIRPSTPDSDLPPPGTRIDPSYRSRMATISAPRNTRLMGQAVRPVLDAEGCKQGACTEGWRFVAIEITHPRHDEIEPIVRDIVSIEGGNPKLTLDRPHGLRHFNRVHVAGVEGMKGVNGSWQVSVTGPDSFRLVGAEASGSYSGGGYIVHALSSRITDCANTSPIVCTTATRHGLDDPDPMEIESIDGAEVTLRSGRLRIYQGAEISDSPSAAHNGVWAIEKASGNKVMLKDGPKGRCRSNCGTISWRRTVQVAEVEGNTAANGSHLFRVVSDTKVALLDASGNGSYTSGGFLTHDPDMYFSLMSFGRGTARIVVDRSYFHGQGFPSRIYFAFQLDADDSAVIDSYLEEIHFWAPVNPLSGGVEPGGNGASVMTIGDAHRVKLSNNAFVNSPGIPVFTQEFRRGPEMAPTDIEITRNLFYNSERYRAGSPQSDGRHYNTSHLLEFKKGQRILIDGNIFDGNWADRTPTGPAILFSPRGARNYPNNVISDVTVTNNVFRRISHALYVVGAEGRKDLSTDPTSRIRISNNLFQQIDYWQMHSEPSLFAGPDLSSGTGAGGAALWIFGTVEDVEFTHNTVLDQRGPNPIFVSYNFGRSSGVVIRHNIFPHNHDSNKGGVPEAWSFEWAAPPISGSPSEVFRQYFTYAPGPDPNSTFSDNVVIPGVRGTAHGENFDNPARGSNFTKSDCEDFYRGFSNITCAGTGQQGETANQRARAVFSKPGGFRLSASLPDRPGIDEQALERALGMTVDEALRAGEQTESLGGAAALRGASATGRGVGGPGAAPLSARLSPPGGGECGGLPCSTGVEFSLRDAMANVACGDHVELPAGETIRVAEPVSLGGVDCPPENPVFVTAAGWDLPSGVRVTPAQSPRMARIEARGFPGSIFVSAAGSALRGVVFRGLELVGSEVPQSGPLVRLEAAADIRIDQCHLRGGDGIASGPAAILSGERISVSNSFFDGFWAASSGPEVSTLIVGGPGLVEFANNYIEAATAALNVRSGTAIQFRHNSVHRPFFHSRCSSDWDAVYRSAGNLVAFEDHAAGTMEYNLLEESIDAAPRAAIELALPSAVVLRANIFRNAGSAIRIGLPESRPVLAAAAWQPPRIVIEDNLLEPGDTAAASLCDTAAAPVLLDPADLGRLPAGLLSLSGNRTGRDLASGGAPNRDAPEEFGERAPARILDLQTNAQGGEIIFQYAVSAPGSGVPCTVELWPPGRPFEGVSTFDSLRGSKRAAAVSVPGGGRRQYRLMCGGDLQRGVIP